MCMYIGIFNIKKINKPIYIPSYIHYTINMYNTSHVYICTHICNVYIVYVYKIMNPSIC